MYILQYIPDRLQYINAAKESYFLFQYFHIYLLII